MRKIFLFVLIIGGQYLYSQSVRYWSNRFNTKSSLLGDAVVAGNSGITAIYFNPAHIPESDFNQLSFNANVANLTYTNFKNSLGDGIDMLKWGFRVQPRFISLTIHSSKNRNLSYQFALFNKSSNNLYIFNDYFDNSEDGYLIKGNKETYYGVFDYGSEYYDYRGGFGAGYKLNDQWKAGVAVFGIVKNYFSRRTLNITVNGINWDSVFYTSNTFIEDKLNAYDIRFSANVGISYTGRNVAAGLTFHSPSVKLWGDAYVLKSVHLAGNDLPDSILPSVSYNEAGRFRYDNFKDPFSIALGLIFFSPHNKIKYYFSTEYFFPLKKFKVIDGTRVVGFHKSNSQKSYLPGSPVLDYYMETKGVLNVAVGIEYDLWDKIDLMAGFKSDFEASLEKPDGKVFHDLTLFHETGFNYYHFNFGAEFGIKKSSIIAGAQYNIGIKKRYLQYANFKNIIPYDPVTKRALQGPALYDMKLTNQDFGFYFGILYGF